MQQKLSIIIPVFNEANTFRELFKQVYEKVIPGFSKEIIIIESNSSDGSRELALEFGRLPDVKLILQDKPKGKGFALREGFKSATGDIILIQDADLEYEVSDYESLLAPLVEGRTDFVLGSRHLGINSWHIRSFNTSPVTAYVMNLAHQFFTWLFNVLYNQKTTDPATMFKVFRRECLTGIEFTCDRFDFDFELVCKLALKGYKPIEVPVTYTSRGFAAGKKVRFFRDPITWMRILIGIRFSILRKQLTAPIYSFVRTVFRLSPKADT